MMNLVFLVVALFTGLYFSFVKPNIDAFTFGYLGSLFYFSPAFQNTGYGIGGQYAIHPETQFFGILLMFALIMGDKIMPRPKFEFGGEVSATDNVQIGNYQLHTLFLVTTVLFLFMFSGIGLNAIGAPKGSIPTPPFTNSLFRIAVAITFIASAISRHRTYTLIIGSYLLAFLIVFQVRSTVAYSIAPVLLFYFRNQDLSAVGRLKYGILGMFLALSFLLFDKTKGNILHGNFHVLFKKKPYLDMYFNNNAQNFVQIFELTIANGFQVPNHGKYLAGAVFSTVPLAETLFGIPSPVFGEHIIRNFLPFREAGIASSIWAEAYAIAGVLGVVAALLFYITILATISANLESNTYTVQIAAYSLSGYLAVHIQVVTLSTLFSNYLAIFGLLLSSTGMLAYGLCAVRSGVPVEKPQARKINN